MKCVVAICALVPQLAVASPAWRTSRGDSTPGREAGSFVLFTDAAPGRFSEGAVVSTEPVRLPFRIDVTWRRLGPEAGRSMHVTVAGGVVLIKSGKLALYGYDEGAFARAGWRASPAQAHDEHRISVVQTRSEVVVTIDGTEAARFPFVVAMETAPVGVGMKGATGHRSAIFVRALAVRTL